jgi:transposase-like protein
MGPRPTTLEVILRGFPEQRDVIERTFRDQPSFRELCEDYHRCAAALGRWRRLHGEASSARSREYAELLEELTREIEECLGMATAGPSRPGGAAP